MGKARGWYCTVGPGVRETAWWHAHTIPLPPSLPLPLPLPPSLPPPLLIPGQLTLISRQLGVPLRMLAVVVLVERDERLTVVAVQRIALGLRGSHVSGAL